jgi:YbgC/YbaW family acyl-CoA thioester hydrolase
LEKSSTSSRWSEHRLRRRVQFYEVDSAGIVHFSQYFHYMEEAEHALWRDAGLSIAPRGADIGFPRVAATFDYHRFLRFEEEFDVWIRIVAITEKSIRYTCQLTRDDTRIATGSLTVACVKKWPDRWEAIPIPPGIATRFEVAAGIDA